jgi:hypothetical protein
MRSQPPVLHITHTRCNVQTVLVHKAVTEGNKRGTKEELHKGLPCRCNEMPSRPTLFSYSNRLKKQPTTYSYSRTSFFHVASTHPPCPNDVGGKHVTSLVCVIISWRPENKMTFLHGQTQFHCLPATHTGPLALQSRLQAKQVDFEILLTGCDSLQMPCVPVLWTCRKGVVTSACFPSMEVRRKLSLVTWPIKDK